MTAATRAADPGGVERRVGRLADIEQIGQLTVAYKNALDAKDVTAYVDLFSETGTLWCTPELQARGRAAIRDLVEGMSGNLLTDRIGTDFHATANSLIEVEGDQGSGSSTWLYFTISSNGAPLLAKVGHYVDQYIRHGDRWLFQRRDAVTDIPFT